MPGAWYNQAEAKSVLDRLSSSDVCIDELNGKFVWGLKDPALDKRLEQIRTRTVDEQVGYKLDDAADYDAEDRWFTEEESQASISDRLLLRFDDPNVLQGYGLETANKLWQKDPNVIKRTLARQKDIAKVQEELENAGRL